MRIGIIVQNIFELGGVQRVVSLLANQWSSLHSVEIVSPIKDTDTNLYHLNPDIKILKKSDVDIFDNGNGIFSRVLQKVNYETDLMNIILSEKMLSYVYYSRKMRQGWISWINGRKYDVVIGVTCHYSGILSVIQKYLNCKVIGWQHNSHEAYFEMPKMNFYPQRKVLKKYLSNLNAYVVLNEIDANKMEKSFGYRPQVIYNPRSFHSEKKTNFAEKKFIAAGRLEYVKGYDLLLQSFKLFLRENPEWVLEIWGEGSLKNILSKQIKELGLDNRVYLMGYTNNIAGKLLTATAFCLTSRWEGMPMTVLEALEIGLPVICYDIDAIKPLITNEVEGIIVNKFDVAAYADAMLDIARDERKRYRMSTKACLKADRFSIEKISSEWEKLFSKLEI